MRKKITRLDEQLENARKRRDGQLFILFLLICLGGVAYIAGTVLAIITAWLKLN